jgi:hypothetical protein
MTSILLLIGVGAALAVLAILTKIYAGGPKKAEKWEKGEILKQLLALSEQQSASPDASPPGRKLRLAFTPATRGDPLRKGTLAQRNQSDAKIDEEIRQRAYQLYQERGGAKGDPTDDWLQAKKEVLSRKAKAGKTSS